MHAILPIFVRSDKSLDCLGVIQTEDCQEGQAWMKPSRRKILIGSAAALLSPCLAWPASKSDLLRPSLRWANGPRQLKGVNVFQPFGWGNSSGEPPAYTSDPYVNGGTWAQVMPASRRALIKSSGFDVYRFVIDPGPLLAAESSTDLDHLITQIKHAIVDILDAGLLVIADVHVTDQHFVAGWTNVDLADGVSGPKFKRLVLVEQRLATAIEELSEPSRVCIELFNEPPYASAITSDQWHDQLKYLFDAVRYVAPSVTLVIGGSGFNSIDDGGRGGLVALDPKKFDENTIYSWHGYEPVQLSIQAASNHFQYIHRLAFPPRKEDRAKAIKDLTMAIDADSRLSAFQKAAKISYFTRERHIEGLDSYFDTPQDEVYIAKLIKKVTDWADTHGVLRSQLMLGEFGCNGDFKGVEAATLDTRVAYIRAVRRLCDEAAIGAIVLHELNDNSSGMGISNHKTFVFIPEIISAMGLGQ